VNSGINTDQIDTRNVPGYLSHYQLLRPPFSTEIEDDMYYPDPGQKQRLDLILHLTQFSDDVLILTGDMGCGKTTLAHQFVTQSHPNWKVCSIAATITMTPGHLLKQLNKHFEFSPQSQLNEDTLQSFKLDLAHHAEKSILHVLLIDDAHLLSSDTFRLVMDLSVALDSTGNTV
jgi:type II secretory pathway predicted ATPase ExeA